jgi:predicted DNA-binding transcriptional regulator YafY
MLETSARLLQLLALFQGRRYWCGPELADRLEITCRTLRRDVDKLRSLGYPIASTSGTEGGYQLGAGTSMPPLLLEDEEAVAVALGLRSAAAGAIEGIEQASVRALSKIEQILPARLKRRVEGLQAMIVTSSANASPADGRILAALAGACRDQQLLRFGYRDRGGAASTRSVEPHRLVHTMRRWYLVAFDTGRGDWRTFRVDRMEGRPTVGERFAPRDPPADDLVAYVTRGMWQAPPCRATIKVFASARSVTERLPPCVGAVEPLDDHTCVFETGASTYESLAVHLLWLGFDFHVVDPPELAAEIRRLAARLRSAVRRKD